jgi:hypothetical protein
VSTGISDQPGSREPGLDQLISALTADGYLHELAGRDVALAAFRSARKQPRRRLRPNLQPGGSARLGAVAAAAMATLAGLTAAAYAQALPAPMQHFAYSVLSSIGVPNSETVPPDHPHAAEAARRPATRSRHAPARQRKSRAVCPCSARTTRPAIKGSTLTIAAARIQFPANGWDDFRGTLTHHGRPERGVRLMLLEQTADASGWQRVGSGLTGPQGGIRVGIAHLTQNATFEWAAPDGVASSPISVTVIPHVSLWRAAAKLGTDRLMVSSRFGDVGDVVVLEALSGSSWQRVASEPLNAAHRASFELPAATSGGQYYRAVLQATAAHGASVSEQVFEPRVLAGDEAILPHPVVIRPGLRGHHTTHHKAPVSSKKGSPTPDPTPSSASPVPTSSGSPSPSPASPSPGPTVQNPISPDFEIL